VCCCGRVIVSHADVSHGKSTQTGCSFGRAAGCMRSQTGCTCPLDLNIMTYTRQDIDIEDLVFCHHYSVITNLGLVVGQAKPRAQVLG
jgi:hypothetical protein